MKPLSSMYRSFQTDRTQQAVRDAESPTDETVDLQHKRKVLKSQDGSYSTHGIRKKCNPNMAVLDI